MSIGTITIEYGVMPGPEVGLFTVNHEPNNIRVIKTKENHIKKNAWIGARVNILAGMTIGEGKLQLSSLYFYHIFSASLSPASKAALRSFGNCSA